MTRNRIESTQQMSVRNQPGPVPASPLPSSENHHGEGNHSSTKNLPSIRLIPHQDPRPGRPSLQFPTMSRTLPDETCVIRVGRYSERDNAPEITSNVPSTAPIGFKSKVVSRKHCELWCNESQWYIKDVGSSSGTFLNRIRLSQPNQESKPFAIKDGDIIQLGIDFRGGEEMIFRCVKIRVECNRGWQRNLNTFNKQTHQRLRNLGKNRKEADSASQHTSECVICLMSIAPCQSLFVAPCSHVWHYKCIRPMLNGPNYPNFLCPNCRAVADLEAEVEDIDLEDWDNSPDHSEDQGETSRNGLLTNGEASKDTSNDHGLAELAAAMSNYTIEEGFGQASSSATPQRQVPTIQPSSSTQPVNVGVGARANVNGLSPDAAGRDRAADGPLTPRNNVGPFVFDGSAGQMRRLEDHEHYEPLTINLTSPFTHTGQSSLNDVRSFIQTDSDDRQPLVTSGTTPVQIE
ncbi:uncharacterized protein EI97DRAFT_366704 [Westerdykella ornata]|uniref:RING-type E3 ubiquitin transferase n=1 Tax=Westerdykella ornata TaxID=318751 RepID=A0A6A6K175_WESOR|nr:uncharacterized protein EI97DRAFT_366704 [Westerdykella ornata]KAF2281109.1 hypothetical protein EI97DRAFT_366704 [Westerdykella ornata]